MGSQPVRFGEPSRLYESEDEKDEDDFSDETFVFSLMKSFISNE